MFSRMHCLVRIAIFVLIIINAIQGSDILTSEQHFDVGSGKLKYINIKRGGREEKILDGPISKELKKQGYAYGREKWVVYSIISEGKERIYGDGTIFVDAYYRAFRQQDPLISRNQIIQIQAGDIEAARKIISDDIMQNKEGTAEAPKPGTDVKPPDPPKP